MRRKEILKLMNDGYDLDFLARVQPQGNFKRHGRYIETGDGYLTCLRLWKYPAKGLQPFWGVPLTMPSAKNSSTLAVISIGTENRDQILAKISKSAGDQYTRVSSKAKVMDNVEAMSSYNDLVDLTKRITQKNEVVKRVYFRLFVYAPTLGELEEKCKKIIRQNTMFRMARYVDEQVDEFRSIFVPAMQQENLSNAPKGTPIDAENLAGMYPFNHVKLEDPNGSYYGFTRTNGEIIFDPFQRDNRRTRSFFFVTGNAGMGKSTLLKKMNDDVFSRGAIIRNFDVSSEYTQQTIHQGGTIIKLDQPEYRINPFEIFPTVVNDDGTVDEVNSFHQNITKLKNFFRFLNGDVTNDDLEVFSTWLTEFYREHNLWIKNPEKVLKSFKCTGLPRSMYPTLEDFVLFANEKQRAAERDPRRHITSVQVTTMNRITTTFSELQETQGSLFDGQTNFPDIKQLQVVTFNIQGLLAKGQGVFNAQIYSVLSLLSADIIQNGMRQRELAARLGRELSPSEVTWYYLNIDEVENIINPRFSFGVEFLASMMEQMRKNLCAITMAAPTIKDLIMNGNSHDPYILAVQKMFSLFQIRFFFQISDDDLPRLSVALGGSTTMDELEALTKLEKSECLMNINGDRNVQFKVQITEEEKQRYRGGI